MHQLTQRYRFISTSYSFFFWNKKKKRKVMKDDKSTKAKLTLWYNSVHSLICTFTFRSFGAQLYSHVIITLFCSTVHVRAISCTLTTSVFCELFSDLLTAFLIGVLLALFEQLPALAAHDHALSARNIFHARHKLSTEHGVTVPGETAWEIMEGF